MIFVEAALVALICALVSRYFLHMLQLESYQLDGYFRWLKKNTKKALLFTGVAGVSLEALWWIAAASMVRTAPFEATLFARAALFVLFAGAAFALDRMFHKAPERKPFALTARMKRLYGALTVLTLCVAALFTLIGSPAYALMALIPLIPFGAGALMQPIERRIAAHYLAQARAKLDSMPALIKVGITGSYGKTSTKFILETILSEQYSVLATPASFNTPMGLTKVIREQLTPAHQVFLAEMGARHVGDIEELVALVCPKYGVLTSVGPQHLETFKTVETVANTKYELIDGLPEDGVGFFAAGGGEVDQLFARASCEKYRAGLDGDGLFMRAGEVKVGAFGSRFTLTDAEGASIECETVLLGAHNIQNIALCCAVARRLGLSMAQIARGVHKVKPIEHRLQVLPGANGLLVIDDAFNSNPAGAKAALTVLSQFEGRHIIVTPGMVELGEKEAEYNRAFGRQIAACCDIAILIGAKRTIPIAEGIKEAGMDVQNLHVVADLNAATEVLKQVAKPGDVVLFENDLPDNYAE